MKETMDLSNRHELDCRRYIKPGDVIQFGSMYVCECVDEAAHRNICRAQGRAVRAFEQFVYVKLRNVKGCVNRWRIRSISGKKVSNGCFRYLEAIK